MAQKGRPQGGKNRNWSKEDKLRIVRRYFYENIGERVLAKEENIWSIVKLPLKTKRKPVITFLHCMPAETLHR